MKTNTSTGHTRTGSLGELAAADFLRKRGFRIEDRNVRTGKGELDLVAWDGDVLCFVEVKARTHRDFGGGAAAVDDAKQQRLWKAAEAYLASRDDLWSEPPECRFDVVVVRPGNTRLAPEATDWHCELFRNAFAGGASR